MYQPSKVLPTFLAMFLTMPFLVTCNGPNQVQSLQTPLLTPLMPELSINEIMVGQVDHAANFILAFGTDENQQLLENAWEEAEHHAIQLMASSSAITLGGTGISDGIWSGQPSWRQHTQNLHNAAAAALLAARDQDLISIQFAADLLRTACDNCHAEYKPDVPTQGIIAGTIKCQIFRFK